MLDDVPGTGEAPATDKLAHVKQDYELVQDAKRLIEEIGRLRMLLRLTLDRRRSHRSRRRD